MLLKLYNTATRKLEHFTPQNEHQVAMYNCGPTVYNYAHIGNLRAYVFADVLRRTLEMGGYSVKQVVNITDVGHLVSDGDEGEDKMVVGAKREGKSIEDIITRYSEAFYRDLAALNIQKASQYPRATEYIKEQIALINILFEKKRAYATEDGIYFDTSRQWEVETLHGDKEAHAYSHFAHLNIQGQEEGIRVQKNFNKTMASDFALWRFSPSDGVKREQEWNPKEFSATWNNFNFEQGIPDCEKIGFPGWHLECSAIIKACLGETIDIHTGGIDHIPVHHTNEIAQSESANGVPLANVWMHSAFMNVDGQKMSKSLGNTYRLDDFAKHSLHPLDYRYWLLTAHYRTQLNFTWESLNAAATAYLRLSNMLVNLGDTIGIPNERYIEDFKKFIDDDLNTASALALVWDLLKDTKVSNGDKIATIFYFDTVLGLGLEEKYNSVKHLLFPPDVTALLLERRSARDAKNFAESDRLRSVIREHGYEVKDTPEGQQLEKL